MCSNAHLMCFVHKFCYLNSYHTVSVSSIINAFERRVKIGVNSSASSLRSLVGISSGPIALCTWRLESSFYISSLLTLMLSIEGCVLGPMSGIVDSASSLLKTDTNCSFKLHNIFAFSCKSESYNVVDV